MCHPGSPDVNPVFLPAVPAVETECAPDSYHGFASSASFGLLSNSTVAKHLLPEHDGRGAFRRSTFRDPAAEDWLDQLTVQNRTQTTRTPSWQAMRTT